MAKKIAEQLIDTLVESGVERIYAVTGDSLNEINRAVRKNNKIQGYMYGMKKPEPMPQQPKRN